MTKITLIYLFYEHPSAGDPAIQQHEVSSNNDPISRENESDRLIIIQPDDQTHKAGDMNSTLTAGRLLATGNKILTAKLKHLACSFSDRKSWKSNKKKILDQHKELK